jgi:hypothetical protein
MVEGAMPSLTSSSGDAEERCGQSAIEFYGLFFSRL